MFLFMPLWAWFIVLCFLAIIFWSVEAEEKKVSKMTDKEYSDYLAKNQAKMEKYERWEKHNAFKDPFFWFLIAIIVILLMYSYTL